MNQLNAYMSDINNDLAKPFCEKKRQARAIESDNKMVEQTIILLSEGGVSAVTLEAVGVNAGYSRGLVSRRYGSKDKLLIRVFIFLEDWLDCKMKQATKKKYGVDAINALFLDLADDVNSYMRRYRAYFWLRFYGLESNKELNQYLIKVQEDRCKKIIQWLKEASVLEQISRSADLEMMADFIMTSMIGLFHNWMVDPNFKIELRLKQLVNIHFKTMFENSHLYYLVNYWGE